jgi:hypothetical protein
VFVDDRDEGLTPATMRGLSAGIHTVRVMRDGYRGQTRRVSVGRSQLSQPLTFELVSDAGPVERRAVPSASPASLRVESRPTGARVFVDRKLVGTTPLVLGEVTPGSHMVWLELDGYRRWIAPVKVVAGQSRVAASLEP